MLKKHSSFLLWRAKSFNIFQLYYHIMAACCHIGKSTTENNSKKEDGQGITSSILIR